MDAFIAVLIVVLFITVILAGPTLYHDWKKGKR